VLNVRDGPGTSYGIIGRLGRGDEVLVLGRADDGSWCQVGLEDGGLGWVSSDLVKLAVPVEQLALAPTLTPTPTPTATTTPDRVATDIVRATTTAIAYRKSSTATAIAHRAGATATVAAYSKVAPKGRWCAENGDVTVCVGQFQYSRSMSLYTAGQGMRFVGFGVTVSNGGSSAIHVNPNNVTLVDLDGRTYSHDVVTYEYVEPLDAVDVQPGEYTGGMIAFHTRSNSGPAKVIYDVGLFEPTVTIDLTKPPIRAD
jgi:hypothetical protein